MSHYTVMVLTTEKPTEELLGTALAPYDENMEAEPYRDDVEGPPDKFWAVDKLREEGLLPAGELSWEQVREAYIKKYPDSAADFDNQQFTIDPDDPSKAFTMSTYNPQSKWDWWTVGGRWSNRLLGLDGRGYDQLQRVRLDLEGMRNKAGDRFRSTYWQAVEVNDRWPHRSWKQVLAAYGVDLEVKNNPKRPDAAILDAARLVYREQRSIAEFRKLLGLTEPDGAKWFDAWDRVLVSQREFDRQVEIERASAVPCRATLDLAGRWNEPGKMGWFGMSSDSEGDRIGYYEAMNGLIESLDPAVWLTVVDVHI